MKITNNSKALQGVQTVHGMRFVRPGETKELHLNASQAELAGRLAFLALEGDPSHSEVDPIDLGAEKDGIYIPAADFNKMRSAFEDQLAEIKRLSEENAELRALIETSAKREDHPPTYEVKETSSGWYGVFKDGQQIGKSMRHDDAEAFKALSAEEQAAYLEG